MEFQLFVKRLITKFVFSKSDYHIFKICITTFLHFSISAPSTLLPTELRKSVTFSSKFSWAVLVGISRIFNLFLQLYWFRLLLLWSSSNNCSSNCLTLFWSFKFSSLRASMIEFLVLIMLSSTLSVTDFLILFSFLSNQVLISENLMFILFSSFSNDELSLDLKIDSSCFTPPSLVFGLVMLKIRYKMNI